MIASKHIPYQNIPDAPGKTIEEITALGQRLFPFSPHSFQLAMCVYDWTTASFTRMVFLKIFEYTGVGQAPFPLDQRSIAQLIWASTWKPYKPSDADFMHSFMMAPAASLQAVETQLAAVAPGLHRFSTAENRLLSAALQSLPRISAPSRPRLYSGQMDIAQLGADRFGVQFLECPRNAGPVGAPLVDPFAGAVASYLAVGRAVTTKMAWSFTGCVGDAMRYSNGLLLVAECPEDSVVWETAACVTPLSDDPDKVEYTFMPGSRFEVQAVEEVAVPLANNGKAAERSVTMITLRPKGQTPRNGWRPAGIQLHNGTREGCQESHKEGEAVQLVESCISSPGVPKIQKHQRQPARRNFKLGHRIQGRRCTCVWMMVIPSIEQWIKRTAALLNRGRRQ